MTTTRSQKYLETHKRSDKEGQIVKLAQAGLTPAEIYRLGRFGLSRARIGFVIRRAKNEGKL